MSVVLIYNARVRGAVEAPASEAILVERGTIAAVGDTAELEERASNGVTRVDAGGRRVVPGLIDGHAHVLRAGLTWGREIRWDEATSLADALELLRKAAADAPRGSWLAVIGGWHPGQFAERRFPGLDDLDQAAPDNPCYVQFL
ncbi:MAG: amidohydrolase family protein, partial [Actinobacteria bacterium]|nr:amidohydrolase family protein [Actinomycetota bacterium]NIU64907.1 amidohydrolase family protein [Actinomycetota bacterium]NIW26719.1 amidohydrolase family protein [Actinomycetota bacterium]